MIYKFGQFELDVTRRELRLEGRELALQPRVFDVLVHLVERRDRVVTKDELLHAIWPDVVVSDGSLKRAVSLARSALREGGVEGAIRNYARQGYRFDYPDVTEAGAGSASAQPDAQDDLLTRAYDAHRDSRWVEAASLFAEADALAALGGADLERWGKAAQLAGEVRAAVAPLERAVAAYGALNDPYGVSRVAQALAMLFFESMDMHVARGWLARARSVLPAEPLGPEHGTLAALSSRFALGEGDLDRAVDEAEKAIDIARTLADLDIELFAMSYLGMALVARGEVERGLTVHDEAAAVVLSTTTTPLTRGLVYCGLIWTCRNRSDWQRAAEWTESFTRWCGESSVLLFSGNCRLHRAEVLRHRGELEEAEREVNEATAILARFAPYAEGDAFRVLGDLRLEQGNLEAAEAAYRRSHELGWDPQPGLALLLVEQGKPGAALQCLERSIEETRWANRQRRGLLLASLVPVALAADSPARAREALEELDAHRSLCSTTALEAAVCEGRAELAAHEGQRADAIRQLRASIAGWHKAGAPLRVARTRLRLTEQLIEEKDLDAAELELSAVQGALTRLSAPGLAERCRRLVATLGR